MAYQKKDEPRILDQCAFILFEIEAQDAVCGIKELHQLVRKKRLLSESDKIWFEEIDKVFTEEDKIYWMNLMRYAAKLERD